jgi:hypothetical protein
VGEGKVFLFGLTPFLLLSLKEKKRKIGKGILECFNENTEGSSGYKMNMEN